MLAIPDGQELYDNASDIQNGTLTGTAETRVLANAMLAIRKSSGIVVSGHLYIKPGPGVTAVTPRIRKGYFSTNPKEGTVGAIVWEVAGLPVTPGVTNAIPISGIFGADECMQADGGQHSVTLQQVGAAPVGNGSVIYASVAFFNTVRDVADPQSVSYWG